MEKQQIIYISKHDGLKIHADYFKVTDSKALIVVFHGMAEHRHRYDYLALKLTEENYSVLTIDHRGHNQSKEVLGHFADKNGWQKNLDDLHELILMVDNQQPLYLFGHSMGSMFARSYLKRHEDIVKKVVLSGSPSENKAVGAGIVLAKTISAFKGPRYVSALLDKMVVGQFNKGINKPRTNVDWLSKDESNVEQYISDRLCGFPFTTGGHLDLFYVMKDAYSNWNAKYPSIPIKFFSGSEDPCSCKDNGVVKAVEKLKSNGYTNVSYKLYDGLRHEILNEKMRDVVIADIIDFYNK